MSEKPKVRVLIVDDAKFMRAMIRDFLIPERFEVVGEASNGFEAVDKYKELKPDLVTMDIALPGKSGIDATKEIVSFDKAATIVVFSGLGYEKIVIDAIEAGAADFLVKPFKGEDVLRIVDKVLASKQGA